MAQLSWARTGLPGLVLACYLLVQACLAGPSELRMLRLVLAFWQAWSASLGSCLHEHVQVAPTLGACVEPASIGSTYLCNLPE